MDEILEVVRSSISTPPTATTSTEPSHLLLQPHSDEKLEYPEETYDEWEGAAADEFDDAGHGAGVEGDLEMDDDD